MNSLSNKFKALLNTYYHDLHPLSVSTSPSPVLVVLRVEHVWGGPLSVRKYKKNLQGQEKRKTTSSWDGIHKEEAEKEIILFCAACLINQRIMPARSTNAVLDILGT